MATGGIQGQLLDITVVGCNRLRDTEWISRQDPYVCLDYANNKFQTKTCTDGGKNPTFNEKFVLPLIEGLRELNVSVWNSNTLSFNDLIGTGKILLQRVLSSGYDDSTWPLNTRSGKNAGEVRIILHYANVGQNKAQSAISAPPYTGQFPMSAPYAPPSGYPTFQQAPAFYPGYPPVSTYKSEPTGYPTPQNTAYPPQINAYPPPPCNVYTPPSSYYPATPAAYAPSPYGTAASNSPYPPPVVYPPPHPQGGYPALPYQGYYPGAYPPQ